MKRKYSIIASAFSLLLAFSCTEKWDDHYSGKDIVINSDVVKVVNNTAREYIQSESGLSSISALFQEQGIFDAMDSKKQLFTLLAYSNDAMAGATIEDQEFFARTCVCDLAFTPTKLTNGLSMQMWNGKYLSVSVQETAAGDEIRIAQSKVKSVVQVNDGFVYLMESPIYAPKSLYEMLNNLGDNYSLFKELVSSYEVKEFDKANSIPKGVDQTGNTVYDSVFVVKNTLMDRYNSGGSESWNMRSEFYSSTMLIPSDVLIKAALDEAYEKVREALSREPNANDSLKFREFILKSAFYDRVLTVEELNGTADLYSVSGYLRGASASTPGVQWKPDVQKVNTASPVELSNGVAYYQTSLKIPNNVVIYRIKNHFYLWDNCNEAEKAEYFKWTNLENPDIWDNGGFGPLGPWPYVSYKVLRAYPTAAATAEKLPVAVECTGIALNADGTVSVAMIPPGEYDLRMGFRSDKYPWRLKIYFNDELVATGVNPNNAHYDRTRLGYPEGYVWRDWYSTSNKASYYDCDGMQIATVTVTGSGLQPIRIKMVSDDMTQGTGSRNRMIIHSWTLRPTANNY